MMFANVLTVHPVISIAIAMMVILGISFLGNRFLRLVGTDALNSKVNDPIFGALIVSQIVFVLVALDLQDLIFFFAIFLSIFGFLYLKNLKYLNIIFFLKHENPFCILLLIFYFLYSLGPLTNADSIDYHVGVPFHILNYGSFPNNGEWLSARLFGFGEYVNLLGLSIGTVNLGSILQFLGLLSIYSSIVSNIDNRSRSFESVIKLSILALPVLIFLIGTAKFQLFPIALIILSLNLYLNKWDDIGVNRLVFLILFLCMSATLFKFNYLLAAFIISVLTVLRAIPSHQISNLTILGIGFSVFFVVMLPFYAYKAHLFDATLVDAFLTPTVGNFVGYGRYVEMLAMYDESVLPFPISMIFPDRLGGLSTIIGLGFATIFLIDKTKIKDNFHILAFMLPFALGLLFFGQYTSRTFLDLYFVLIMFVVRTARYDHQKLKFFEFFLSLQAACVALLLSFGVFTTIGGVFSNHQRLEIMKTQANGFDVSSWIDTLIPENSSLIVTNRSMSFSKNEMISGDWIEYVDWDSTEPLYYVNKIANKDPKFIFFIKDADGNFNIPQRFRDCFRPSDLVSTRQFKLATRNPYNRSRQEFFLMKYDSATLSRCLNEGH